ncbi:uncharacterized protein LOC131625843 [Vicia villosa]|uniref:uncharacterized protein LOC131625843 n=1 Tax=Vicia villosa TaxID=3911 RepID=UPI00273BB07F|nr:uncharacterized protein LOC131625843 [Vicia villosa]
MYFYRNLMGKAASNVTHINIAVMRKEKVGGYVAKFFKVCWPIIKTDVVAAGREFFDQGQILKEFNKTVVTLILKTEEAKHVKDYIPIARCITVYKIISKIMTSRLGKVLPSVIGVNQATFIPDWYAMEQELNEIGLPRKFIHWVMAAQNTISYVFNVNSSVSGTMQAKRGLRQGDPISPLLFVTMMEYLKRLLDNMQHNYNFNHHAKCERLGITNITFADDVLLLCKGEVNSVNRLLSTANVFSASTRLVINPKKCKVYCGGMDKVSKVQVIEATNFDEGQLPFRYLGVPITSKKLNTNHHMPLIDRIMSRIMH